jgi:pimeloyl-ACP methyl ester carboxylesterase
MLPVVKSVQLPGRVRLEYVEQGDPAGIPVVMLHGVTDSWHSFGPVLPHLPESVHAFALTQRGHGDADRPASGYRTRDFAADVAAFADALRLGPVVVVGHSMGSTNAKRFAIDYPARTRGLVLVGTFATYRNNPTLVEFWQSAVSTLTDPIDPDFAREFQESTLARRLSPAFLETVVRESLKVPARVWRAAFEGFLEDDFASELGEIAAPTLVLWGDRDRFARRTDQDALVAGIAGSRLAVYEGTGHALHWEEPERFAVELTSFVEGVAGRDAVAGSGREKQAGRLHSLGAST